MRVNYDLIAHLYDEPGRDHGVDANLLEFLRSCSAPLAAQTRVLDVGCGTGKQLAANRARLPGMSMVGLDLFTGMLDIAKRRDPTTMWVNGDGTALPFATGSFDYVSNQFSYPHVREKARLLGEVLRVLQPGGRFVMTNIDPWSMRDWVIYRYFPAAWDLDQRDFLPVDRFTALMREVGFTDLHISREQRLVHEDLREFLAYASQRYRTSQLLAIADQDYLAGLHHLEQVVADAVGPEVTVCYQFGLVTISGVKPMQACPRSLGGH